MLHTMSRVNACISFVACLLAIIACMHGCEEKPPVAQPPEPSVEQRVKSLVSVGMCESHLVEVLEQAGIKHGDKVQPVKDGDYYQIHIPIRESIGTAATVEYTITGTDRLTGKKAYLIITLDTNGIVTAIE